MFLFILPQDLCFYLSSHFLIIDITSRPLLAESQLLYYLSETNMHDSKTHIFSDFSIEKSAHCQKALVWSKPNQD